MFKKYEGTRYYHAECPTEDCKISFYNSIPSIIGLPHGQVDFILMKIHDKEEINNITKEICYDIFTKRVILDHIEKENTIELNLNDEGIVSSLKYKEIDYSFRQENKANLRL